MSLMALHMFTDTGCEENCIVYGFLYKTLYKSLYVSL